MTSHNPKAGIFIPTMNRIDFVIRQLRYYASINCPHTIYIGDSSPKNESEKIEQEIKRLGEKIKAKYYYLPSYNDWQAHSHLISQAKEKYICYSGDDDYQIPDSITKCIEFLEANPGYTSASGHAVSFRLQQSGPYGELRRLADYPRQQIENDTGAERIIKFFTNYYVTHFSVNRTEQIAGYWQSAGKIPDRSFRSEILPTSLPLIYGKSKIIDCLGFVRQIHGHHYELPNIFDWITNPEWQSSYSLFEKIISENLAIEDNISIEDASKAIRQAFWAYLQKYLSREYEIRHPPKKKSDLVKQAISSAKSKIARTFPILKQIYRMQIKPRITKKKELSFEVLQPKSKYYKDFKPVMDSFTRQIKI